MLTPGEGQRIIPVASASRPYVGMFSDVDKSLLGGGMFALASNVRGDKGYLVARNTDLSIMARPSWATAAEPLGSDGVILNGTPWEVAVFSDGSTARIAVSTLSSAAAAGPRWVEVTGTGQWTGPSGNNRLTSTTALCQLTVIKLPRYETTSGTFSSRDALLIQNGTDFPRIWDPDTTDPSGSPFNVTAVANNAGQFRLTIGAHSITAGSHVYVANVGGLPQLTGLWQVASVTATTINLLDSVFAAGFTAGGTVDDRMDMAVVKDITDYSLGTSFATATAYWPLVGGTSTTYYVAGVVNQARYRFQDSTAVPYDNSNSNISWEVTTTVAANDIAAVYFPNMPMAIENRVLMLVEGEFALGHIKNAKIEVNDENVAYNLIANPWTTLYDPSGATDTQRSEVYVIPENTAVNRYWLVFDSKQIAGTVAYHMRFTRQGSAQPAATQTMSIIAIVAPSCDIPASSQWGMAYEDSSCKVEQRFHAMTASSDNVGLLGGSQFVRDVPDGSTVRTMPAPGLPLSPEVPADWRFTFNNSNDTGASSIISGGLDGIPERLNLYVQLPGREKYYFACSANMYQPVYSGGVRAWNNGTADLVIDFPLPSGVGQAIINNNREAPSEFQVPIPVAKACLFDNGRLFVGAIQDASSQFGLSDVYGSWSRNPLRFQQVQEDELRGFYLQVSGETVQAFSASASASLGAGRVFLFTDKNLYTLGDSGPYSGASIGATELSTPYRIGPHGTLSPRSIAQGYSAMFWVDQDCKLMKLGGGSLDDVGKKRIADRLDTSVISRKPYISGVFLGDRYTVSYTPLAGTTNTQANVWCETLQNWESEDYITASLNFSQFHIFDTPTGTIASRRIFFYDTAGALYAYNEVTSGTITVDIRTGEYSFSEWQSWYIREFALALTQQASGSMSCARYSRKWGESEPWTSTIAVSDPASPEYAEYLDALGAPVKTGPSRGAERDWAWQAGINGSVTPGTQFFRWELLGEMQTVPPTKR